MDKNKCKMRDDYIAETFTKLVLAKVASGDFEAVTDAERLKKSIDQAGSMAKLLDDSGYAPWR